MLSAAFICLTPTARGMFLLTNRSVGFHQVLQSLNIIDFVMLLTLHGFLVGYLSLVLSTSIRGLHSGFCPDWLSLFSNLDMWGSHVVNYMHWCRDTSEIHSLETLEFEVYLCQCFPAIDRNHWQLHLGSRSEWSTIHISSITLELSLSTTFFSLFPSHGTWLGGVQVVLELCSDGTVVTSDQPPTVLGSLPSDFLQQVLPQHCVFADSIYDCSHVLTHLIRENLRLEYCCSFFSNLFHWSPVAQWLCHAMP
jgi:hypothetical protein